MGFILFSNSHFLCLSCFDLYFLCKLLGFNDGPPCLFMCYVLSQPILLLILSCLDFNELALFSLFDGLSPCCFRLFLQSKFLSMCCLLLGDPLPLLFFANVLHLCVFDCFSFLEPFNLHISQSFNIFHMLLCSCKPIPIHIIILIFRISIKLPVSRIQQLLGVNTTFLWVSLVQPDVLILVKAIGICYTVEVWSIFR